MRLYGTGARRRGFFFDKKLPRTLLSYRVKTDERVERISPCTCRYIMTLFVRAKFIVAARRTCGTSIFRFLPLSFSVPSIYYERYYTRCTHFGTRSVSTNRYGGAFKICNQTKLSKVCFPSCLRRPTNARRKLASIKFSSDCTVIEPNSAYART